MILKIKRSGIKNHSTAGNVVTLGGSEASGKCEAAKAEAEASGLTPLDCDDDGYFKDKQCEAGWWSTTCWCVDQDGEELEGTRVDGDDVDCVRVPGESESYIYYLLTFIPDA